MKGFCFKMKKQTAFMGVFLAFALILSYVESLVPFYFGIPGIKLGLANLAVLLALYVYGIKEAFILDIVRVLLAGFMFGNLFMIMYSMAGAMLSFLVMCLLKRTKNLSIAGVSVSGGVFHNIGQILVAVFVTKTSGVFFYLPALLLSGVVTGFVTGAVSAQVVKYIKRLERQL